MNHELNAQVAEEVMGWKNTRLIRAHRISTPPVYIPLGKHPDGKNSEERIPDFSGSLDTAWQMEEEIARRGLQLAYTRAFKTVFVKPPTFWGLIHATAEQRCRAALEAVREKC